MAAVTVTGDLRANVAGRNKIFTAKLTAPANGDTLTLPLQAVHFVGVTFASAAAAADSTSAVVTFANQQAIITFTVIGTARDLWVKVEGN